MLFNKESEKVIGVHIIGLHAADLIQECSNAVAAGTTVRELSMMVSAFVRLAVAEFFFLDYLLPGMYYYSSR